MSKAEKTRQFIIEKTAPIFNRKGYAATSLADITEATGLTKGSIYGNFENKEEVVIEALRYNVSKRSGGLDEVISASQNPLDALIGMLEYHREKLMQVLKTGGCPMLNAATEADNHLDFLKNTVQRQFQGWQMKFIKVIEDGQAQGYFKKDISADNYAKEFIMLIEGGILLSGTLDDKKYMDLAVDRGLKIIETEIKI
ncbi:TetR/AcrR family transcriptional regulator [Empedobacter falsenii]|nr:MULTISPECIES: TetR/AcrR family transcriptional regulator [Empedobacter]MDM1039964.1 TetR/AcrR family transcriptional regulator [Empedobacter brevis]MDM1133896.1 TetR/AcrR family transcriptional regulator [Empedobacter sp. R750]